MMIKRDKCERVTPARRTLHRFPVSFAINIYNGVIIKLHHRLPIELGLNAPLLKREILKQRPLSGP